MDLTIATRIYSDWNPKTGEDFEVRDRLIRKPNGSLEFWMAGELPGDPEVVKPCSLKEAHAWLQDLPEQIERAVIEGGV